MSMIFYMDPGVEINVDNPGYGQISLYVLDHVHSSMAASSERWRNRPLVAEQWHRDLHGDEIGEFLEKLTERALTVEPETPDARPALLGRALPPPPPIGMHLPPFMKPHVARALLPVFQKAVVLAVGGSERYDRVLPDQDGPPQPPFCVRCDLGTFYTPGAMPNTWCEQYGHTPFGTADGTSWAAATTHYERRRNWWDKDRQRERDQAALESGLEQGAIDLDRARRDRRPHQEG